MQIGNDSRLKRVRVEKEVVELGKYMGQAQVLINLDFLDAMLKDVHDALWVVLFQSHRVDIVHEFSDFLSFLSTFKKVYDDAIADIEHLVKATKTVRESSALELMMEAKAKTIWPHRNE